MASLRKLLLPLAGVLLALAPVVALAFSPWSGLTGLLMLGMLPAITAVLSGPKAVAATGATSVVVAFAAVLVSGLPAPWLPILGALLVAALGMATAGVARVGLHAVGGATIALAAYLLVDPRQVVAFLHDETVLALAAEFAALLVLGGSAWVLLLSATLFRRMRGSRTPVDLPLTTLLAVLCGGLTLVCLVWLPHTNAWWTVMTVALVLQPTVDATRQRIGGRIGGTVAGGTAAALIAGLIPSDTALVLIGVAAALAGVATLLTGAAYWLFSALTTVSVVLVTFERDAVIAGDLERIVFTLIAAAVTTLAVAVAVPLARRAPV